MVGRYVLLRGESLKRFRVCLLRSGLEGRRGAGVGGGDGSAREPDLADFSAKVLALSSDGRWIAAVHRTDAII